jgi:hypothetical protein
MGKNHLHSLVVDLMFPAMLFLCLFKTELLISLMENIIERAILYTRTVSH